MAPEDLALIQLYLTEQELNMSRDALCKALAYSRCKCESLEKQLGEKNALLKEKDAAILEKENYILETQKSNEWIAKEYQRLLEKSKKDEEKCDALEKKLAIALAQILQLKKVIFGRSSEKIDTLQPVNAVQGEVDEATEEEQKKEEENPANEFSPVPKSPRRHTSRPQGKWENIYDILDTQNLFIYDTDEFNEHVKKGDRLLYWEMSQEICVCDNPFYLRKTFTPVWDTKDGIQSSRTPKAMPHSMASPSLAAYIFNLRYALNVTFYRMEIFLKNGGLELSRQTLVNWANIFVRDYFEYVFHYMQKLILTYKYHQIDETFWKALMDNRPKGSKGYVWVHSSGELLEKEHPIILYFFELSRSTEHLRDFYPENFEGTITSDAYGAYKTLAKERDGKISLSGCLAHARRRYVESLAQINIKGMSKEEYEALEEVIILRKFAKIYSEEMKLRGLTTAQRKEQREQNVLPLFTELDEYIESIDTRDPKISSHLKDAVNYFKNQKEELRRFLNDGNIPIDNLYSERNVKRIAISRKNSLFSYSIHGAEVTMIMFSIAATAAANHANVQLYFQFVIEALRGIPPSERTDELLETVMPWSKEYKAYEQEHSKLDRPPKPTEHAAPPEGYETRIIKEEILENAKGA